MAKKVVTVCAVAAAATAAFAALGDVITSFPAPAQPCGGLARDASYLYYVTCPNNNPPDTSTVFRLNPTTGSVYASYDVPWAANCLGLDYQTGGYLWVNCWYNGYIYRTVATTGSVVSSFNPGFTGGPNGNALRTTGDGGAGADAIWVSDDNTALIKLFTLGGSLISTFTTSGGNSCYDMAWDHRSKLLWTSYYGGSWTPIRGYTDAGSLVASFLLSGTIIITGVAYYGENLWLANWWGGTIYQVHCPAQTQNISPASLGKVKALFK